MTATSSDTPPTSIVRVQRPSPCRRETSTPACCAVLKPVQLKADVVGARRKAWQSGSVRLNRVDAVAIDWRRSAWTRTVAPGNTPPLRSVDRPCERARATRAERALDASAATSTCARAAARPAAACSTAARSPGRTTAARRRRATARRSPSPRRPCCRRSPSPAAAACAIGSRPAARAGTSPSTPALR